MCIRDSEEDALMEAAIEAGADDVQPQDDGSFEIYTAWEDLGSVRDAIEAAGFKIDNAEVTMIPSTTVDVYKRQVLACALASSYFSVSCCKAS